jgi:signal transduction histidine kinase
VQPTTQEALDMVPDGVVVADGSGRVTLANAAAAQMLGQPADHMVGRRLEDVMALVGNDGSSWSDHNRPYDGLSTRTGVPEQSWTLPDGLEVLVAARIHRPSTREAIDSVAVAMRNGRGRARLDRERSDLVATVAHELRSPLTGVKGFVQALLNRWDRLSDDQRKLMLTTVHADADRLARLIAELLDVARIDTGRLSLYPRESDAAMLVGRVADSVQAGTARHIELDVADDVGPVFADPDKFTQVVTNLVENAVRHGTGNVTVTVRNIEPGEWPGVRVVVDDEGDGIPEEMRRRVFTKFWKEGVSGGSGLGMYIVGGLTRAHGGTVTISDAPGGGARVVVDWPAVDRR